MQNCKAAIDRIRARGRQLLDEANKVSPQPGTIAIGSEYIRLHGTSESLFLLCTKLESGNSVAESVALAKANARVWAANLKRNRPKDYQVHLWEGYADVYIEWAERLINDIKPVDSYKDWTRERRKEFS